jgi:tetratricopeptide (TPR) repeat protein
MKSGHEDEAISHMKISIAQEEYAMEPIAFMINYYAYKGFEENESKISGLVRFAEKNYDSDKYSSMLNLTSLYYRVGSIYFVNKKYDKAKEFYEKSLDELGFLQKKFFGKDLKHSIQLAIANSLYKSGKIIKAAKVYSEIIADIDEDEVEKIKKIKEGYLG